MIKFLLQTKHLVILSLLKASSMGVSLIKKLDLYLENIELLLFIIFLLLFAIPFCPFCNFSILSMNQGNSFRSSFSPGSLPYSQSSNASAAFMVPALLAPYF